MQHYHDVIVAYIAGELQPLPGATVWVTHSGTGVDAALTDVNGAPIDNPTQADSLGRCDFYAHGGLYDFYITHALVSPYTLRHVQIGSFDINVESFGAVPDGISDAHAAIQAALDYAASLSSASYYDGKEGNINVNLNGGIYLLGAPLQCTNNTYSRITLRDGKLILDPNADWGDDGTGLPTESAIKLTGSGLREFAIQRVQITCSKVGNGIHINVTGGTLNRITECEIVNYRKWGIRCESGGGTLIQDNEISEWLSGQPEFADDANYKGIGIWTQIPDQKIFNNVVRWTQTCLKCGGGTEMVQGNHFYTGGSGVLIRQYPVLIDNIGWGNAFVGNYFDDGEILIKNTNAIFLGNRHAYNAALSLLRGTYLIYPSAPGDSMSWLHISTGMLTLDQRNEDLPYIKLIEEGGNTFLERPESFLLRGTASDIDVNPRSKVFTRTGYNSTRVAEFRGQMTDAMVAMESSSTTSNSLLPGFGARGDYALIEANDTPAVWVSPAGSTGLGGAPDDTYVATVKKGQSALLKVENTNATGTAYAAMVGTTSSDASDIGGIVVKHTTGGDKAAFTGRSVTGDTTAGLAVIASQTSSTLTVKWAVGSALRPWANNTYDLGSSTYQVKNIYLVNAPIVSSDERHKTGVAPSDLGLAFIAQLRPVKYRLVEGEQYEAPGPAEVETVEEPICRDETYEEVVTDPAGWSRVEQRVRQVPVMDTVPAVDEQGQPLVDRFPDGTERPIVKLQPRTRSVTRPKPTVVMRTRPGARNHYGLIAQEVRAAMDSVGVTDFAGWLQENPDDPNSRQMLRYEEFIAPLIAATQELAARVADLETKLDRQRP